MSENTRTVLAIQKIIGSGWWITVQLLYLMGKFADESCIFLPLSFNPVSEEDYKQQTEMSHMVSLTWYCDQDGKCSFQAPPIMKASDFFSYMKDCIENSGRLSVIPLKLLNINGLSHANMLIYDKINNTLERFEPHGQITLEDFNPQLLDVSLPIMFQKHVTGQVVKYISPKAFCPVKGPQVLEEIERARLGINFVDGRGLCSVWSFIYANLRLSYPDKTGAEIMDYINTRVDQDRTLYHYAENIIISIYEMSEKIRVAKNEDDIREAILETVKTLKI